MVKQSKNIVGGDQAAGNIDKRQYTYIQSGGKPTYMSTLIERFKDEMTNDVVFRSMVEKLQHFCTQVDDGGEVAGLEAKLSAGEYGQFLEFARITKEQFSKKLTKYQFYESAQLIHAYVLADIYVLFNNKIYPLIKKGEPQATILSAIQELVISPVQDRLEENVLELFADEINGALYFLTGNCHIKWV
jgi:C-terminal domain 9 of the ABC-three component (ABC-3C) systems